MNWEKAQDYEHMMSYTKTQWYWELLRRNSIYIKEYNEEYKKFLRGESLNQDYMSLKQSGQEHITSCYNFSDPTKDDFVIDVTRKISWGIVHFVDPRWDNPKGLVISRP